METNTSNTAKTSILAERIKQLRKAAGMSQQALGEAVGVSRAAISLFELGTSKPSGETLSKLADALKADINYLLGRSQLEAAQRKHNLSTSDSNQNNVQAVGFLNDMVAVELPFVSFRARASFVELGVGTPHPEKFETLRLYVAGHEEAARYIGAMVFEVEGDSMSPLLRSGDKVIAWQVPDTKWEQVYNQVCVVAFDDTVTIKAVRENELFTRNLLTLYSQNPSAGFLPVQRQQIQSIWRVEEFFDRPKIRL